MKRSEAGESRHFRLFLVIAEQWKLTKLEQRQLLNVRSAKVMNEFQRSDRHMPEEVWTRINYCIDIYAELHQSIFPRDHARANEWIRRKNTAPFLRIYNRTTALEAMLTGDLRDLRDVRNYLMNQSQSLYY